MAPIPVHIEDPISPTKARSAEVQPQTSQGPSTNALHSHPAVTTTATPTRTSQTYHSARPGAAAVPGPTTAAAPQPTRTQPSSAQTQSDIPPPPQPGDAPSVVNATAFHANATSVPPPPKASEPLSQPVLVAPPQAQYSPPELNLAPTHTTDPSIAQRAMMNGPASLNVAPIITTSAQHPPGYVQDAYAQELNPAQRASLELQQEQERKTNGGLGAGLLGSNTNATSTATGQGAGESVGEAWDAVKHWSDDASRRVSQLAAETHEAAWKWIKKST